MALAYTIEPSAGLVRILGPGPGTLDECVAVLQALAIDPAFQPSFGILADLRPLDLIPGPAEARALGTTFERLHGHFRGPIAVVVETPAGDGMVRMIGSHADGQGVRLSAFRDAEDAARWLRHHGATTAE